MDAIPLEGAYLLMAFASGLLGFFAMRWYGLSQSAASFAVAGFLYILARTSFVAGLFVLFWQQVLRIDVSADAWQSLAFPILLVTAFAIMSLSGVMMLVAVVYMNKYGSKGQMPVP